MPQADLTSAIVPPSNQNFISKVLTCSTAWEKIQVAKLQSELETIMAGAKEQELIEKVERLEKELEQEQVRNICHLSNHTAQKSKRHTATHCV